VQFLSFALRGHFAAYVGTEICAPRGQEGCPQTSVRYCLYTLLTPNDPYRGRTAPLTSKRCILCIYSRNISNEYFKHDIYSPFSSLQNAVCFIILTYLVPI